MARTRTHDYPQAMQELKGARFDNFDSLARTLNQKCNQIRDRDTRRSK